MTSPDPTNPKSYGIPLTKDGHPDFENATYDVFTPDRTIAVRAGSQGQTIAVKLSDATTRIPEARLAAHIVDVARLASTRARHHLRLWADYEATHTGGPRLDPEMASAYPTAADVDRVRNEVFQRLN